MTDSFKKAKKKSITNKDYVNKKRITTKKPTTKKDTTPETPTHNMSDDNETADGVWKKGAEQLANTFGNLSGMSKGAPLGGSNIQSGAKQITHLDQEFDKDQQKIRDQIAKTFIV